ncbi:MAG: hypothetical protein ACOY4F_11525 [Thermodesulfobacteriota bacterium]
MSAGDGLNPIWLPSIISFISAIVVVSLTIYNSQRVEAIKARYSLQKDKLNSLLNALENLHYRIDDSSVDIFLQIKGHFDAASFAFNKIFFYLDNEKYLRSIYEEVNLEFKKFIESRYEDKTIDLDVVHISDRMRQYSLAVRESITKEIRSIVNSLRFTC